MKGCYISVGAGLDVSVLMDAVKDAENDIFECSLQHMSAIKFIKNIDDLNKKFGRKRKTGTNQCQQ